MIKLHILNAHDKFTPYQEQIKNAFALSVQRVTELFPISNVDVVFYLDSELVIPEFGIGGYSPSGDRIMIAADPDNVNFTASLKNEFLTTLGHELHHCSRWRTVGYGNTLLEALVSEGLACHFETELRPSIIPFYANALKAEEIPDFFAKAVPSLSDPNYSHGEWFFGQNDEIPLHTGYTLGFELVSRYMRQQHKKASQLYDEPAESFLCLPGQEVIENPTKL
ncbi:MAG: hypothetical protein IGS50_04480 [Synechococcales cyanobacterium C42_A2020_086]|jgi:uncharacterized protein YjaZ|nr:hypothetical protein [Synechococcales cyanobacterium C42_A2020_086]